MLRDAKYSDVDDVLHEVSMISAEEMVMAGIEDVWRAKGRAKLCKDNGFLKVYADGKGPLFIFGAVAVGPGHLRTWFVGTERYFSGGPSMIKLTAKTMATIAKGYKNFLIESATLRKDPATMPWFKTLGFQFSRVEGDAMVYKFVGRNNSTKHDDCANLIS